MSLVRCTVCDSKLFISHCGYHQEGRTFTAGSYFGKIQWNKQGYRLYKLYTVIYEVLWISFVKEYFGYFLLLSCKTLLKFSNNPPRGSGLHFVTSDVTGVAVSDIVDTAILQ
jgi:hypothetical protein